ncbi:hypothetical protein DB459_07830 [Bradyrhizobium sp. WD16]|nr:hypothetical protein DB459_07830 [Bradyrhizobium sp. WD16]
MEGAQLPAGMPPELPAAGGANRSPGRAALLRPEPLPLAGAASLAQDLLGPLSGFPATTLRALPAVRISGAMA